MVDLLSWQQKTFKYWTLNSTKSCLTALFSPRKEISEVTFGIFSVLVTHVNVHKSYLDTYMKKSILLRIQVQISLKMFHPIDDYAKDQGRSDICVVFTMSLCALELK